MARTKRNTPYRHYWAMTRDEAKEWCESNWNSKYAEYYYRAYLLHGTDAGNVSPRTHEYFNRAHRIGRRTARDQLRPHFVMDEDFEFDDSKYVSKYKGVWWDIY